jgi:hypothetical protein
VASGSSNFCSPLTCGYLAEQSADQFARTPRGFKPKKQIAGNGQVVAAQNKALNVGLIQLTHFGRLS